MRYGIFADIHANLQALEAVINAYKKESIDKYFCIGDIVGYGADPRECIERVKLLVNICLAGNHDWASVDLFPVNYFNAYAKEAIFWTKQNLKQPDKQFLKGLRLVYTDKDLTLVHGTLNNPENFDYLTDDDIARDSFALLETDVCFVAHTHKPEIFMQDKDGGIDYHKDNFIKLKAGNKYLVNVGSVGQPRDNNPQAAYGIYDKDKKEIQIKRISYDVQAAARAIIQAGLPSFLADRLTAGR